MATNEQELTRGAPLPIASLVESARSSWCATDQVNGTCEDIAKGKFDLLKSAEAHPVGVAIVGADFATSIDRADPLPNNSETANTLVNGSETDFRMAKIQEILDHAAMRLLPKRNLVAEWIGHAESQCGVFRQFVVKPVGGRPESAVTRAARELPIPGKTLRARRKYGERAIKIDSIWSEAKSAARAAGLNNIKSAHLDRPNRLSNSCSQPSEK
jgi:hypothetical protein